MVYYCACVYISVPILRSTSLSFYFLSLSCCFCFFFFFSSRRRHTRCLSDWSSDVCSSDLQPDTSSRDAATVRGEPEAQKPPTPAILKSGVVDGMGYTLYVDGSIEAELPQDRKSVV